jgi:hypothetical protein
MSIYRYNGSRPIQVSDWNNVVDNLTGSQTKLGTLTLISGSNLILQSGSIIPFALPASYIIFSGSIPSLIGPYYVINGLTNNIDYFGSSLAGSNNPVQLAINKLNSIGGGKIYFKGPATYDFLTGQPAPAGFPVPSGLPGGCGLVLYSNITVEGDGPDTILTTSIIVPNSPTANDYFAMFVNKDYVLGDGFIKICNLSVILQPPSQTSTGMQAWDDTNVFYGAHDSIIENVYTKNGGFVFLPNYTYLNTSNVLISGSNYNNSIISCKSENQTVNTAFFQGTDSWFLFNEILKSWDDAFIIASAGTGHKVIGNIIDGSAVVPNKGASTACIYLQNDGAVGGGPSSGVIQDNLIAYNTCKNRVLYGGAQAGIYELGGRNNIYRDNICFGNAGPGIMLEQCDHSKIFGGQYYKNSLQGIRVLQDLSGSLYDVIIDGVMSYNNGTTGSQQSGINIGIGVESVLQDVIVTNCITFDDQSSTTQLDGIVISLDGTLGNLSVFNNNFGRQKNSFLIQGAGIITGSTKLQNNIGYNPQGIASISVGASPFTYTNNDNVPEAIYISGSSGAINTITKNSISLFPSGSTAATVWLEPGEAFTTAYLSGIGTPIMNKDRK